MILLFAYGPFGCSIFDSGNTDFGDSKIPSTTEIKTKPDGWETTSRGQDGNIWDISQREDDILLQEFERRIAFSKQQVYNYTSCTQYSCWNFLQIDVKNAIADC